MTAFIAQLLSQKIGMDIESVGQRMFQRVVAQQLQKFDCTIDQYSILLQQSNEVWASLVEAIVIPETWFFRYPKSFHLFKELVKQLFETALKHRKLQILCLPCSSGEEAYSIAMTLLTIGLNTEQFDIDAIDINSQVLQQAQSGIFTQYSFRHNNLNDIQQFFDPIDSGYQLKSEVLACVQLRPGNILTPATLPSKHYDFIFCRNLLIYFDEKKQNVAANQLKNMLMADGFLFSGPAEVSSFARAGMRQLAHRDCFAFANTRKKTSITVQPKSYNLQPAHVLVKGSLVGSQTLSMMTKAQLNKTSTTPKATATRIIKPLQQTVTVGKSKENLLQRIEQLSNAGQLDEALDLCQQALSEVGPDAELFYLWGLLLDSMGQQSNAEKYYRKALYMDPLHAAALKQLAALLRAQGHTAAAMLLEQRIKFDRT